MTEAELLGFVTALCDDRGLLWSHVPDSRQIQGDAGVPDLLIAGPYGTVFAELKDAYASLTPGQSTWRYRLQGAGQFWFLWRPEDLLLGRIDHALDAITHRERKSA
jgi:hypothetical protein